MTSPTGSLDLHHPLFVGRTGSGVRVAIVDSGIHADHAHITVATTGACLLEGGRRTDDYVDRIGHGTAVAAAVMEKAPEAEYHIVKVFDDRLSNTSEHVVDAVRYCVAGGFRLINLSLAGTNAETRQAWSEAMEEAVLAGTIVVSPTDRRQDLLPGILPGTLGVIMEPGCLRSEIRLCSPAPAIVAASGYPRPIPGVPPEKNLAGVSFAVANVTGFLARLLEGRPEIRTVDEVRALLQESTSTA